MTVAQLPMPELKSQLKCLIEPIGSNRVVYVDLPIHLNIGDLLINAGVEQMFQDYGIKVDLRLTVFDALRFVNQIAPSHVIILHGGGNFGDIWPRHQYLREEIIRRFPNNRILIYPQSVHFSSEERAREAASVLRAHSDLHIFTRDRESQAYLADIMGVSSQLCPDTAHQLYGTLPRAPGGPTIDRLLFLRRDKEATADETAAQQTDWDDIVTVQDKIYCGLSRLGFKTSQSRMQQKFFTNLWYEKRDHAIRRSSVFFSKHRRVETSRLHGVILAQLLDIPIVPRDNFYGKIANYLAAWGK